MTGPNTISSEQYGPPGIGTPAAVELLSLAVAIELLRSAERATGHLRGCEVAIDVPDEDGHGRPDRRGR